MKIGDESSGDDDSDEDWGKNVKNVVGFDDNESEENESFEEEESVERKRKRKPVTTQKGDSRRKRFRKKTDGKSPSCRLKLDSPGNKLQGEVKSITLTACKPVDSMQENTNCMKPLRQDDGNRICEKLKSVQGNVTFIPLSNVFCVSFISYKLFKK